MRGRCRHSYGKDIKVYQGRNITVCEEWNKDFMSFYKLPMDYKCRTTVKQKEHGEGFI